MIGVVDSRKRLKGIDAVDEPKLQGVTWMEYIILQSFHIFSCDFSPSDHRLDQVILHNTQPLLRNLLLLLTLLHKLVPQLR